MEIRFTHQKNVNIYIPKKTAKHNKTKENVKTGNMNKDTGGIAGTTTVKAGVTEETNAIIFTLVVRKTEVTMWFK